MSLHLSFDQDLWIALLAFGFLCDCLLFAGFCFAIKAFYRGPYGSNIAGGYKILSLVSLALLLCGQIFSAIYIIVVKLPGGTVTPGSLSLWSVHNAFWSTGYTCTYMLYYQRMEKIFKKSVHALTTANRAPFTLLYAETLFASHVVPNGLTVSATFFVLLVGYFVTQQISTVIWTVFGADALSLAAYNTIYLPVLWTRFVIDSVLNAYVVGLFSSKILKLTVMVNRETGKVSYTTQHSSKVRLC